MARFMTLNWEFSKTKENSVLIYNYNFKIIIIINNKSINNKPVLIYDPGSAKSKKP
jgi:hypothetical protein